MFNHGAHAWLGLTFINFKIAAKVILYLPNNGKAMDWRKECLHGSRQKNTSLIVWRYTNTLEFDKHLRLGIIEHPFQMKWG